MSSFLVNDVMNRWKTEELAVLWICMCMHFPFHAGYITPQWDNR